MEAEGIKAKAASETFVVFRHSLWLQMLRWEAVLSVTHVTKVLSQYIESLCLVGSWGEKGQVTCLRSHHSARTTDRDSSHTEHLRGWFLEEAVLAPHPLLHRKSLEEGKQCLWGC